MSLSGACNCGGIRVDIDDPQAAINKGLEVCHCTTCRKGTGAIAGYMLEVPRAGLEVGGDTSTWTTTGDSGKDVTRHFCGQCGSQIFVQVDVMPDKLFVAAGLFPVGSIPPPTVELFSKNKEKWETPYPGAKALETQ